MSEVLAHKKPLKHELGRHIKDVLISAPADGEVLTYVSADGKWENRPPPAGGAGELSWTHYRKGGYGYGCHSVPARGSVSTLSLNADYLYAFAFYNPVSTLFDRIIIYVQTPVAGALVRLGIYGDNGSVYPGNLVLDAGTVDASTVGVKEILISQTLGAGLYWLVCLSNAAPTLGGQTGVNQYAPIGVWNPYTLPRNAYIGGYTFGALPNPFPPGITYGFAAVLVLIEKA